MKLSVPRSSTYNLASETQSEARTGRREPRAERARQHVALRPLPTMSCVRNATSQRYLSSRCRSVSAPARHSSFLVPPLHFATCLRFSPDSPNLGRETRLRGLVRRSRSDFPVVSKILSKTKRRNWIASDARAIVAWVVNEEKEK